MYLLRIQGEFHAAHFLNDYPGDCRRLHGHSWKVEAELAFLELDTLGVATDFRSLKQTLKDILPDHLLLNDAYPGVNPTAENLARILFQQLRAKQPEAVALTVWESSNCGCRYTPEDERCSG